MPGRPGAPAGAEGASPTGPSCCTSGGPPPWWRSPWWPWRPGSGSSGRSPRSGTWPRPSGTSPTAAAWRPGSGCRAAPSGSAWPSSGSPRWAGCRSPAWPTASGAGRRRCSACCAGGLFFTAGAARSARLLVVRRDLRPRPAAAPATNALAQVSAGELTASSDRSKAVALVAAGYARRRRGHRHRLQPRRGTPSASAGSSRWRCRCSCLPLLARRVDRARPVLLAMTPAERRRAGLRRRSAPALPAPPRGSCAWSPSRSSVITGPANSFVFVYAQNVRHVSGALTAAMVVVGRVTGLVGLLAGRWLADHLGPPADGRPRDGRHRRLRDLTYRRFQAALFVGYALGVLAGGRCSPRRAGPLPTRCSRPRSGRRWPGWYVTAAGAVGAVVGSARLRRGGRRREPFLLAAVVTFLPALPLASLLLFALPETKGTEPEELCGPADRPRPSSAGRVGRRRGALSGRRSASRATSSRGGGRTRRSRAGAAGRRATREPRTRCRRRWGQGRSASTASAEQRPDAPGTASASPPDQLRAERQPGEEEGRLDGVARVTVS